MGSLLVIVEAPDLNSLKSLSKKALNDLTLMSLKYEQKIVLTILLCKQKYEFNEINSIPIDQLTN